MSVSRVSHTNFLARLIVQNQRKRFFLFKIIELLKIFLSIPSLNCESNFGYDWAHQRDCPCSHEGNTHIDQTGQFWVCSSALRKRVCIVYAYCHYDNEHFYSIFKN